MLGLSTAGIQAARRRDNHDRRTPARKKGIVLHGPELQGQKRETDIKMAADGIAREGEQKTRRRHADGRPRRICGGRSRY